MKTKIQITCVNNGQTYSVEAGTTLEALSRSIGVTTLEEPKTGAQLPVLAAMVDHKLKELDYPLIFPRTVEFISYSHEEGRRCYIRSLCFVLQNAVRAVFPDKMFFADHALPSGIYCELKDSTPGEDGHHPNYFLTDDDVDRLKEKMQEIIDRDLPFTKEKIRAVDAEKIFLDNMQPFKAELQRSLGRFTCSIYHLDGQSDTFHGPLVPSTGVLTKFDLSAFSKGFVLQLPSLNNFNKVIPMRRQSKIAATLEEYSHWCDVMGVVGIGTLNEQILKGNAIRIINLSECLHERKYAAIADQIYARRSEVKVVFIAGPSSSGKTSSSLRLANQCRILGLNPKVIELDNYFLNREDTPKDEDGEYDFESLYAMDLPFLNQQINDLLAGKEVEIPKFDFKAGRRTHTGSRMHLGERDILIMEGIHALNPEMVSEVDQSRVFRVYASALTSLNIDENNNISTSDNRLLRRIVRDNRVRGITPEDTLLRWHSVRRGEARNIFPFQENADAIFNSALLFELPMLKYYAEPLLRRILPSSPAYGEAIRLLKFLDYIVALQPSEIEAIPPTSIMREFIGGQTL